MYSHSIVAGQTPTQNTVPAQKTISAKTRQCYSGGPRGINKQAHFSSHAHPKVYDSSFFPKALAGETDYIKKHTVSRPEEPMHKRARLAPPQEGCCVHISNISLEASLLELRSAIEQNGKVTLTRI